MGRLWQAQRPTAYPLLCSAESRDRSAERIGHSHRESMRPDNIDIRFRTDRDNQSIHPHPDIRCKCFRDREICLQSESFRRQEHRDNQGLSRNSVACATDVNSIMTDVMKTFKELAIDAYRVSTGPIRKQTEANLRRTGQVPLSVLFYHRIADSHPNGWTMTTSQFKEQLDWMGKNAAFASLEEIQERITKGHNESRCVHITFDDGYAENCDFAIPLLIERQIPCTYFVSLDFILTGRAFPHDAAAGQPLQSNSIEQLKEMAAAGIEIGAHTRNHPDLGKVTDLETLRDEVIIATHELAELIGKPVRYFAFPFGLHENLNADACDMLAEAGLRGFCSAFGAYNFPSQDPFHIRRIHGDPEISRLKNWLSIDPRKLELGRDIEIQCPTAESVDK